MPVGVTVCEWGDNNSIKSYFYVFNKVLIEAAVQLYKKLLCEVSKRIEKKTPVMQSPF